jgi:hypothetical protein
MICFFGFVQLWFLTGLSCKLRPAILQQEHYGQRGDALGKDEQQAIFKVIDLAISNKKMKDNLSQLIAQ